MSECKIEGSTRSTRIIVKLLVIAIFCAFLYIPLYKRVNEQPFIDDHIIEGWFLNTNRDARSYVLPDNVTTLNEPKDICGTREGNKIFLLVIVCSATSNFKRRMTIRDTWGDYEKYLKLAKLFDATENKFKDYNQYDENNIFKEFGANFEKSNVFNARDIKNKSVSEENNLSESSETKENIQQEESKGQVRSNYNTKSNLRKVLSVNLKSQEESDITERILDFKLIFLLGLPSDEDVDVQYSIDDEVEKYGDVIQESFVDSYNNLTIKSIMMLKWITHKCNDSIRYIFKADDDSYINMRRLILNLRRRAKEFDDIAAQSHKKRTEYLLLGDLFLASKPIHNISDKWYSPRYMYRGNVYPRYLSGTGYVLSVPTAHSLYEAALRTNIFHLEDIYITDPVAKDEFVNAIALNGEDWDTVAKTINKPIDVCKAGFAELKKEYKKHEVQHKKQVLGTGGGPPPDSENPLNKLKPILEDQIDGMYTIYDGDADLMKAFQETLPEEERLLPIESTTMGTQSEVDGKVVAELDLNQIPSTPMTPLSSHVRPLINRQEILKKKRDPALISSSVCAERAVPRIRPRHDPQFGNQLPEECQYCCAYEHITVHQMSPFAMRVYHSQMFAETVLETCEKQRQIDLIQNKARLFVMCKFVDKNNDECYNTT